MEGPLERSTGELRILSAELQVSVVSPHTAALGSDALLECTFTVDQPSVNVKHLAVIWSLDGKDLLWFGNGLRVFELRASIDETEIQKGNASLVLSNVTVSDEGTYKCSVIYSPETDTKYLTLNLQATPEIIIHEQVVIIGKENFLRCSVVGFYPVEIDVSWLRDGESLPGSSTSRPLRLANGTFMINSTVPLVLKDSDAGRNFSCHIRHASLPGPLQGHTELVFREDKGVIFIALLGSLLVAVVLMLLVGWLLYRRQTRRVLTLSEIDGPPKTWTVGEPVELFCCGENCPEGAEIKWMKGEEEIGSSAGSELQDAEPLLNKDHYEVKRRDIKAHHDLFTITSILRIIPRLEDEGASFKCSLSTKHRTINTKKEFKVLKVQGFDNTSVVAQIIVPQLFSGVKAVLQCKMWGSFLNQVKVEWLREEKGRGRPLSDGDGDYKMDLTEPPYEALGLNSCVASLTFTPRLPIDQESEFTCRVSHDNLKQPLVNSTGRLSVWARPEVEIKVKQTKKTDFSSIFNFATLSLEASRFYPRTIDILWSCDPPEGSWEIPSTLSIKKSNDGTYEAKSLCKLTMTNILERIKTSYITCHIQHKALEELEERLTVQRKEDGTWVQINQQDGAELNVLTPNI